MLSKSSRRETAEAQRSYREGTARERDTQMRLSLVTWEPDTQETLHFTAVIPEPGLGRRDADE